MKTQSNQKDGNHPILEENHRLFLAVLKEGSELREKKMYDYGLSYQTHGSFGLVVRMTDKMQRLVRLTQKDSKPNFESTEDTAIDIMNYAAMLVMELRREKTDAVQGSCC